MPTVQRSRTITAPPEDVYGLVADPHHMPRWWPGVQGMEGVEDDVFTQVFMTKKGRRVRADYYLVELQPPGAEGETGRVSWAQAIEGTPFERVLSAAVTEVDVARAEGGKQGHDLADADAARIQPHGRVPAPPSDPQEARRCARRARAADALAAPIGRELGYGGYTDEDGARAAGIRVTHRGTEVRTAVARALAEDVELARCT